MVLVNPHREHNFSLLWKKMRKSPIKLWILYLVTPLFKPLLSLMAATILVFAMRNLTMRALFIKLMATCRFPYTGVSFGWTYLPSFS